MSTDAPLAFLKGHGTGNDFVLLPDPDGRLALTDRQISLLCDRRFGVGADGVLRIVRGESMAGVGRELVGDAGWFMDYRNADGSIAEMCGNGARVFAMYLHRAGLVEQDRFRIGTRGGVRDARVAPDGTISIGMGRAEGIPGDLRIALGADEWPAVGVHVPNPHAVAFVDRLEGLGALDDYRVQPAGAFPDGVNVEWVEVLDPATIMLRVHERGVGETLSCGTGACAAAWAHRQTHTGTPAVVEVRVPGGRVSVEQSADDALTLSGPAVIVASGEIDTEWLETA